MCDVGQLKGLSGIRIKWQLWKSKPYQIRNNIFHFRNLLQKPPIELHEPLPSKCSTMNTEHERNLWLKDAHLSDWVAFTETISNLLEDLEHSLSQLICCSFHIFVNKVHTTLFWLKDKLKMKCLYSMHIAYLRILLHHLKTNWFSVDFATDMLLHIYLELHYGIDSSHQANMDKLTFERTSKLKIINDVKM